jgi:RNA polymerase sigma factor (sigma-70 family)
MSEAERPTVAELVTAAAGSSRAAWNEIVERFNPLLIATAHRYRLAEHDVADVAQTVWLHLIEHLGELREPAALPGWLVSTTRHECARLLSRGARQRPYDPQIPFERDQVTPDIAGDVAEDLERLSRQEAFLAGFAELSDSDRRLLVLLVADPPLTYAEISERLQIPIGSIGPTRGRALKRLRATAAVSRLVDSDK